MNEFRHWNEWPAPLCAHEDAALATFDKEHHEELEIEYAIQFFFTEQWEALRAYCTSRDIRVMGDMAIFVSYDSADV